MLYHLLFRSPTTDYVWKGTGSLRDKQVDIFPNNIFQNSLKYSLLLLNLLWLERKGLTEPYSLEQQKLCHGRHYVIYKTW